MVPSRIRYGSFLCSLILLVGGVSCKKEPTTWNIGVHAPIMRTTLDLENMLGEDRTREGSQGRMDLILDQEVYSLPFDSLVKIPDTTLTKSYTSPLSSITLSPGQNLINSTEEREFVLQGVELSKAVIDHGWLEYQLESTIKEATVYNYTVPGATKNGQPLTIQESIPAGTQANPSIITGKKDLTGYVLDLTGSSGSEVNKLLTQFNAKIDPNGQSVVVEDEDSLIIQNTFSEMKPRYAKGYFGQRSIDPAFEETSFGAFNNIVGGSLDIDSIDVWLTIDNGIGMDARATIERLASKNTRTNNSLDLNHSVIGSVQNITRAKDNNGDVSHTIREYQMDESNSNVDLFLENLPTRIGYDFRMETDPLGDVSNGNDFMYKDHSFSVGLKLDMPLSLIANNLTLVDTIAAGWNTQKGRIEEGTLRVFSENSFPLEAVLEIVLLDEDLQVLDTLVADETIHAAPTNSSLIVTGVTKDRITIPVPPELKEKMDRTEHLITIARFDSPDPNEHVDLYDDHLLDLQLTAEFDYKLSRE